MHPFAFSNKSPKKNSVDKPSRKKSKSESHPTDALPPPTNYSRLPKDFQLTEEVAEAFKLMEDTNENIYITGKAGTGKSTLLHYFKENTPKNVVVLAPTGIAAINAGGATIHSFFRLKPQLVQSSDIRKVAGKGSLFKNLDTVVIDEVSMVRADVMDGIDIALRINRGILGEPFGGVQMIFIGDLYQLSPVVEPSLSEHFTEHFESPYFFSAHVFHQLELTKIELKTTFRQRDPEFIELLDRVRNNDVEASHLTKLNSRFVSNLNVHDHPLAVTLTSTNALATSINESRLNALKSQPFTYGAEIHGTFDENAAPADRQLLLKAGAQVMMVRNDSQKRWVNGSIGIIKSLTPKMIEVQFPNGVYSIEQASWEKVEYKLDPEQSKIVTATTGSFKQFPIRLAWAMTIHKSQGKTFDTVIIDLGRGAFAHGQTYVALSRCRSFEGIFLRTPINKRDMVMDPRVGSFMNE